MERPTAENIEHLFDGYYDGGCPCRYPRFRAAVARDLAEVGAPQWGVSDTWLLLSEFDRRFSAADQDTHSFGFNANCASCGARVKRFGVPVFRDSFIERAIIEPQGAPDIGADVIGVVPIVGVVYPAGPDNAPRSERERIEASYPRFEVAAWLSYMTARREPPSEGA